MSENLSYDEKVTRIMFIREHRRNLLTAYCAPETSKKEKEKLKRELEHVGMFPP
jgi:hypothetical protein